MNNDNDNDSCNLVFEFVKCCSSSSSRPSITDAHYEMGREPHTMLIIWENLRRWVKWSVILMKRLKSFIDFQFVKYKCGV